VGTVHRMWSWIAVVLTAWFSLALVTGLVLGRAAQLRDTIGVGPRTVADTGEALPNAAPARAFAGY
jgi:hypothetical protein